MFPLQHPSGLSNFVKLFSDILPEMSEARCVGVRGSRGRLAKKAVLRLDPLEGFAPDADTRFPPTRSKELNGKRIRASLPILLIPTPLSRPPPSLPPDDTNEAGRDPLRKCSTCF
ncbi:hypothetical protein TNCT_365641 [Trichonephila clavata]|uniref:Uncharacterized protein n=1 Tax=Trichonephila clavata TaxID=2740835 RepID=A0A8X6L949_TRICU|nr:hypothetical protein TNCT_365641 [Trichonephila clavata]